MAGPCDLEGLFDVFLGACSEFKSCPENVNVRKMVDEFVQSGGRGSGCGQGEHRDWVILDHRDGETRELAAAAEGGVASQSERGRSLPRKVLVLGSGGLSIGQAGEFDYSGSQVAPLSLSLLLSLSHTHTHSLCVVPSPPSLSLSFSLSHTHTHTHSLCVVPSPPLSVCVVGPILLMYCTRY